MIRLVTLAALAATTSVAQPVHTAPEAEALAVRLDGVAPSASVDAWADPTARPDDWIARDKALHLGASFLLTLSGQYVLTDKTGMSENRALPVAVGSALALGLLKEVADSQRERDPHFCWRDLAVDAVGVALAVALIEL